MSVFDGEQTTATEGNQNEDNSNQDYLSKVVQSKGDHWTDPQTLAKGYLSAQEYIAQLEQQTKELKEDLGKQDHAKELLEKLQSRREPTSTVGDGDDGSTEKENTTPSFSEDELKSLIQSTLGEMTETQKREANVSVVDSKLSELYGDKAGSVVKAKSEELGLSLDQLKGMAADSPQAFFRLIGADVELKATSSAPRSSVNTNAESFNGSHKRNFEYYQKIRKENSKLYYSNSIQQQMLQDRVAMGSDFFN